MSKEDESQDERDIRTEEVQASASIALLAATELIGVLAGIMIQRGVCTPRNIMDHLDAVAEDAKPVNHDSPEMKVGKALFAQSIALLRQRLSDIETVRERGRHAPATLQ